MKKHFGNNDYTIDTTRYFPLQELLELMKENLGDKYGSISIRNSKSIAEFIYIEGKDGFVSVFSNKTRGRGAISVSVCEKDEPFLKGALNEIKKFIVRVLLWIVTLGILFIIDVVKFALEEIGIGSRGTKKNRAMAKAIAEEIEKIVI